MLDQKTEENIPLGGAGMLGRFEASRQERPWCAGRNRPDLRKSLGCLSAREWDTAHPREPYPRPR